MALHEHTKKQKQRIKRSKKATLVTRGTVRPAKKTRVRKSTKVTLKP